MHLRFRPGRQQSLSGRLVRLTIGVVILVELLLFVPDVTRERQAFLFEHMHDADLAVLAAASAPGGAIDPVIAKELLRLSGTQWVRLKAVGAPPLELGAAAQNEPVEVIDLRREDLLRQTFHALQALFFYRQEQVEVQGQSRAVPGATVEYIFQRSTETLGLRSFAQKFLWLAVVIAGLTGALVYFAALVLMVLPMRQIIRSIIAFRDDPANAEPLDPAQLSIMTVIGNDEIAVAARELAAMQDELHNALWRHARLAALGTAVAKISHDLRGILAPALLNAERLQRHSDEKVRQIGETLERTVDRATALVRQTLDFAREGPPTLTLAPVTLASLIEETGEAVRLSARPIVLENHVVSTLKVEADRNQLFRVMTNLLRNASEAGARTVRVHASGDAGMINVDVADDGPGLPEPVTAALFRPFVGSVRRGGTGLGLAIARDLMLAHGGDIELVSTGPGGTVFRLTLRAARQGRAEDQLPATGTADVTERRQFQAAARRGSE